MLSSCFDERCEAEALSVLAETEVYLGAKERTESSFASPPHARRRVQLSFTERFEILGGDSLELDFKKKQYYIYGSEICC